MYPTELPYLHQSPPGLSRHFFAEPLIVKVNRLGLRRIGNMFWNVLRDRSPLRDDYRIPYIRGRPTCNGGPNFRQCSSVAGNPEVSRGLQ